MSSDYNPYASTAAQQMNPGTNHDGSRFHWVTQLVVVGVLQIVLGVFELLFGAYFLVIGLVFGTVLAGEFAKAPNGPPAAFADMMLMYFVFAGAVVVVVGVLRIIAGAMSFFFRGRALMIAALVLGLLSCATIYCSLLAVPMCIYGMIVVLQEPVAFVYGLRKEGKSPKEIRAIVASKRAGYA